MRQYLLASVGAFAGAAAAVSLTPAVLGAQAAKPAAAQPATAKPTAAKPALKRTADGHPDLQGLYDVSTMTPVDRAKSLCPVMPPMPSLK